MLIAFLLAVSLFGLIVFGVWKIVQEKTDENEQAEEESNNLDS